MAHRIAHSSLHIAHSILSINTVIHPGLVLVDHSCCGQTNVRQMDINGFPSQRCELCECRYMVPYSGIHIAQSLPLQMELPTRLEALGARDISSGGGSAKAIMSSKLSRCKTRATREATNRRTQGTESRDEFVIAAWASEQSLETMILCSRHNAQTHTSQQRNREQIQ
jgi:hypothetical protein